MNDLKLQEILQKDLRKTFSDKGVIDKSVPDEDVIYHIGCISVSEAGKNHKLSPGSKIMNCERCNKKVWASKKCQLLKNKVVLCYQCNKSLMGGIT